MIVFSSIFDINSYLNLSTHLQDKFASIPTSIHYASEIATQLNVKTHHLELIATAISGLNQNWWNSPLISGLAYTSLGILISLVPRWISSRKEQRSKILAGLASYESTRLTLVGFNKSYVDPHIKNAQRLADYLLHSHVVKDVLNRSQSMPFLFEPNILFNTPEFYKYVKTEGTCKTLDPEKIIVDPAMIQNMINNIARYPHQKELWDIELVFDVLVNNPIIFPLTLLQQLPHLIFHDESWARNLSFISHYNPRFLVAFDKAFELLNSLNNYLLTWNSFIEEHKSSSQKNYMFKFEFIKKYLEYYLHLYSFLIKQNLAINELGIKFLLEYLKNKHRIYYLGLT